MIPSTQTESPAVDSPEPERRLRTRHALDALFVVVLIVLAIQIRRPPLGPASLWLDDSWPALVTRVRWSDLPLVGLTSPGFSAVVKAWTRVVGFTEYHAQQPAFAFGVLGPAVVYVAARRMHLRVAPALVAATILLVSRNHVIYSSRVKQYTLDSLLSALIILLTVWLLEDPERAVRWSWLIATAAVATIASSLALPTISGALLAGIHAAWKRPVARRVALRSVGTYAVFALLWWLVALRPRINPDLRSYWSAFYIRLNLHFPRDVGVGLWRVAHGLSWAPTLVSLLVLVVAAVIVIRARTDLAILLLTPLAVAAALATVHVAPLGAGRTDLALYPALALLVGIAIAELRIAPSTRTVVAVVMIAAIATTNRTAPAYPLENMRSAVAHLSANVRPRDEVLVYWAGRFPFALYARQWSLTVERSEHTAEGFEVRIGRSNLDILPSDIAHKDRYAAVLAKLTKNKKRVWFIGSHGRLDVVTIEKDLKALGYHSLRRHGDSFSAFATLWSKG